MTLDELRAQAAKRFPGSPRPAAYGDHPLQVMDLWGDVAAEIVVVSVHGGYFAPQYDRTVNEALCRRLAHEGALVANIEYRRTGSVSDARDTVADVRAAVAQVVGSASGQRVVVVGHSAGGYLALASTTVAGVAAVVPLSPVTDLRGCAEGWDGGDIAAWIGVPPAADPDRWEALELRNVGTVAVPCTVLHGVDDDVVPMEHSVRYVEDAQRSGWAIALTPLDGTGHYEFLDAGSAAVDSVVAAIGLSRGRA